VRDHCQKHGITTRRLPGESRFDDIVFKFLNDNWPNKVSGYDQWEDNIATAPLELHLQTCLSCQGMEQPAVSPFR
jgi:hypothetical protein